MKSSKKTQLKRCFIWSRESQHLITAPCEPQGRSAPWQTVCESNAQPVFHWIKPSSATKSYSECSLLQHIVKLNSLMKHAGQGLKAVSTPPHHPAAALKFSAAFESPGCHPAPQFATWQRINQPVISTLNMFTFIKNAVFPANDFNADKRHILTTVCPGCCASATVFRFTHPIALL